MASTSSKATVLVCDDEPAVRFAIEEALESLAVTVIAVGSGREAVARAGEADVIVTDLVMPEMDGLAVVAAVKAIDPDLPVVMLTARGSEKVAVAAIKQGAYDYLGKPFSVDELRASVTRALETRTLRRAAVDLEIERAVGRAVVGESAVFRRALDEARKIGRRDVTVLVHGETGTGKELFASVLHAASARRDRPCVRFNCAAIAESLAEAELFGHEKGAFTGATTSRPGYFRQASGGTLVLDEIGELPLGVQGKLLRVLQEQEIQPVGAARVEKVDVRVVACTHRDLRAEVKAGRFREDLFYRIAVVEIAVPPLRDRPSDIPLLVEALRARWSARFDLDGVRFSAALVAALATRPWPGNVRELENAIARLLALAEPGTELGVDAMHRLDGATAASPQAGSLREQVAAHERAILAAMLDATEKNQSEAARRLGISRMTLIEKMKRYGLK